MNYEEMSREQAINSLKDAICASHLGVGLYDELRERFSRAESLLKALGYVETELGWRYNFTEIK